MGCLYLQQDSNLQNWVSKTHAYTNSAMKAFYRGPDWIRTNVNGFADRPLSHSGTGPYKLAAVVVCRSCCNLVMRFYICLVT